MAVNAPVADAIPSSCGVVLQRIVATPAPPVGCRTTAQRSGTQPERHRPRGPAPVAARGLAAILVSHLVLAAAYARTTPPWETPDEPWHMSYIVWLRETHRLPPPTATPGHARPPGGQPGSRLYYAAAARHRAVVVRPRGTGGGVRREPDPLQGCRARAASAQLRPARPVQDAPDRPIIRALLAARAVASLFGALAVWAVWRLARVVRPSRPWLAVGAAALAAWTPQLVYLSAAASKRHRRRRAHALALGAAIAFPRRPSARGAAGLGALYGLAALAKSSALALGPLVALAILVGAWRPPATARRARRPGPRRGRPSRRPVGRAGRRGRAADRRVVVRAQHRRLRHAVRPGPPPGACPGRTGRRTGSAG
ncbi:MAG: hypothetical protein U0470_13005 [Anaerolineae bacterium]